MGFSNKGKNISFLVLKPSCLLFIFFTDNVVKAFFFFLPEGLHSLITILSSGFNSNLSQQTKNKHKVTKDLFT